MLAGNNIKTLLVKNFIPTPALSFAIKKLGLSGGIMVTASHNPPQFNGIKFKTDRGCSADLEVTKKIEHYIGKNKVRSLDINKAKNRRLIETIDILPSYKRNIRKFLNWDILKKSKIKVLVDNMYGVCNGIISDILKNTDIKVTVLHKIPQVNFGNTPPEPIEGNLTELVNIMKRGKFDIGLATDGDGDRLAAITPNGRFINPSEIFGLLMWYFLEYRKEKGIIAKTISCSSLIDKIAKSYNLELIETPIGFKYLAHLMMKKDIMMAGEESGGIGIRNYLPERDGILIKLLLLEMLTKTNNNITELLKKMQMRFGRFYYQRKDIKFPQSMRSDLVSKLNSVPFKFIMNKKIKKVKRLDGIKFILEEGSWLLYRFSGTEPMLRIYVESNSLRLTSKILNFAFRYVQQFYPIRGSHPEKKALDSQ